MKKILLIIIGILASINSYSASILWIGIDENAVIDFGLNNRVTIFDWVASLSNPDDATCIIRSTSGILYDATTGWEANYSVYKDEDGSGYWVPKWSQVEVLNPTVNPDEVIYYDIGYWIQTGPSDEDWDIVVVGTASATLAELNSAGHIYGTGSLNPPIETEWRPAIYNAVPEPNVLIMSLLGISLLFVKRRKSS